ncbi:MAG: sulfatase-like hydrolase/transferase [Lentisphaerae bacterium]|nr:sulfatase-like hydrolase/transferase [Lentisphaerota bacterium]
MKQNSSERGKPDILLFLSDQHNGLLGGFAGHAEVRTPNLDRLAREGAVCATAYTPSPLCVPARSALLTGQLPSHNGVFDNSHAIRSEQSTFLHALGAAGYETVLCGRMHFVGADQRHGFSRRIHGDITGRFKGGIPDGEPMAATTGMRSNLDVFGGGNSFVLEYDRSVVEAACAYLREPHDRPQCLVVGTYGPHSTYLAPPEYFDLYRGRIEPPPSWDPERSDPNPYYDAMRQRVRRPGLTGSPVPVNTGTMLAVRAAYYGMITEQDRLVGRVREAWAQALEASGREGLFLYTSDHGDTCGEHGIFGKHQFYEGSARVPLIWEGAGLPAGTRLEGCASLLDLGPTLCAAAGAACPPAQDGIDLLPALRKAGPLPARPVLSELVGRYADRPLPMRMLRRGPWKLTVFHAANLPDLLFHVDDDPHELNDRATSEPGVLDVLRGELYAGWDPDRVARVYAEKREHLKLLQAWEAAVAPVDPPEEKWPVPPELRLPPGA